MKTKLCIIIVFIFKLQITQAITHKSFLQYMPTTLDPLAINETNGQFVANNTYDGLVEWDPNEGIIPKIAESWIFENNNKTVIFNLRRDYRFCDGSILTSEDVINNFQLLISNKNLKIHFNIIAKVEKINDYSIKIVLRTPSPYFIHLLAATPAKIVKRKNNLILSAGQFCVIEKNKKHISLALNIFYPRRTGNIDKISFTVLTSTELLNHVSHKSIDDYILHPTAKPSAGYEIYIQNMWATWGIAFNMKNSKITRECRTEIINSLSSKEFIKFFPGNLIANGFLAPNAIGNKPDTDKDSKLFRRLNKKNKQTIIIKIPNEMDQRDLVKKWIETKENENCKIKTQLVDFVKIIEQIDGKNPGNFLLSFNTEYPDPLFLVRSLKKNAPMNYFNYNDEVLEKLIKEADEAPDTIKKSEILAKINSFINNKSIFVPLMHVIQHAGYRNCIKNIKFSPVGEGYFLIRDAINLCQ